MAICYPGITAGLTNQKIALIGLIHKALRDNTPLVLPQIVSFHPQGGAHEFCNFDEIYQRAPLEKVFDAFGIPYSNQQSHAETENVDGWQCFWEGADRWGETGRAGMAALPDLTCQIIRHLVPAPLLSDCAKLLLAKVEAANIDCAIQMRIENDWQGYSADVLPTFSEKDEDYCPDFQGIMQKVVATLGKGLKKAYVLCDEGCLPVSKDIIREHVLDAFGIELFWKSDFLPSDLLKSKLVSSILDFEVALHLSTFVGNSRSTFSCFVTFEKICRTLTAPTSHYIYNLPGPFLGKRRDNGAMMVPQQAIDTLYGRAPLRDILSSDLKWPLALTAHVSTLGDFKSETSSVKGIPSGNLIIDASYPVARSLEGFSLEGGTELPDIEYRTLDIHQHESAWDSTGTFCGSRGQARPLCGFAFRITGPASLSADCLYAGRFDGHSEIIYAQNGEWCRAPDGAPLTALHLLFRPKPKL